MTLTEILVVIVDTTSSCVNHNPQARVKIRRIKLYQLKILQQTTVNTVKSTQLVLVQIAQAEAINGTGTRMENVCILF